MLQEVDRGARTITGPADLASLINGVLQSEHDFDQDKEHFYALGFNTKNIIQYVDLVSLGTLDASLVHPRETYRHAVNMGVSSIAFAHNHPSGNTKPSDEDYRVTQKLIEAGKVLGIDVLDHIIVGNGNPKYFSMRESSGRELNW